MKGLVWALTVALVLCAGTLGALVHGQAAAGRGKVEAARVSPAADALGDFSPLDVPRPAPDVRFSTRDGRTLSLDDFHGRMVLVNFWATWCQPCIHEMPSLDRLQAKLGGELTIIAIAEDRRGGEVVDPFVTKLGLRSLKTYLDPESNASHAFDVEGLPTSYLIDRDGQILGSLEGGADWDTASMIALLRHYAVPRDPVQRASTTR
jgi:thiol-disulfide isomerase/thioredoxin